MTLGNFTTNLTEYFSCHALSVSNRKTNENNLNNEKLIILPNEIPRMSGSRVGKSRSSMDVKLSVGFSTSLLAFPSGHKLAATAPGITSRSKAGRQESPIRH